MKYSEIIDIINMRKESFNKSTESKQREIQERNDRTLSHPAAPVDTIIAGYYYIKSVREFETIGTLLNVIYSENRDFTNGVELRISRTKFYGKAAYYKETPSPTFEDYPIEAKDLIHVTKTQLVNYTHFIFWNRISDESK